MQLKWKLAVAATALVAAVVVAYSELVLDILASRSPLTETHAISSSTSILTADYNRAIEDMKKRYGQEAQTSIENHPARFVTRVGGKVVEENNKLGTFSDARGLFVIGPRGQTASIFPFQIDPRRPPKPGIIEGPGVQYLKGRFGEQLPPKYLAFDDRDAVTGECITISTDDVGWLGRQLRLQSNAFCTVVWKGPSPGSMVIGVTLADGDPWMRPFSRRICRWLTTIAMERITTSPGNPLPNYAACLLVDRPDRSGAADTLQAHVYEVDHDKILSYVN
jgi:hypothetical protein